MNTTLSSAQQAQMEQYEVFARQHVAPIAQALANKQESLKDLLLKAGEAGYLGLSVPKDFGGSGLPFLNVILLTQVICRFEPGLGLALASHTTVIELIRKFGNEQQKSRYLPLLARGECLGAIAFSEVNAGTDFMAIEAAVKSEKGKKSLTGQKTWVVNGDISNLLVVLAKHNESETALYLVDISDSGAGSASSSLQISEDKPKLGLCSQATVDIGFNSHELQDDCVLAVGDLDAKSQVLFGMDIAKVVVSAAAVGLAEGALECAAEHARTREQFGESIGNFQAIQWKLADISLDSRASRLLTYRAAWSKDGDMTAFRRDASMAKAFSARAARVQSAEALQVLGAAGITCDSPVERFYRDAKVMEIVEGTSEYQKVLLTKELGI